MTTVHLTNAWHASSGGIRTFYSQLIQAGNEEGRRVVLIVPDERDDVEQVGLCGCIYRIKSPPAPAFDRRYRLILPSAYAPLIGSRVARILRREQPSVVEICDKYSLPYLAAMLRKHWHSGVRRPFLVGLSCERFDDNMAAYLSAGHMAGAFTQWYIRHIYGPPFDVHVAISDYTAVELRRALWDRAPGFVRLCPMGVDVDCFGPQRRTCEARRSWVERIGGSAGTVLLLYAGRLSPEKNLPLLLAAFHRLVEQGRRDYRLLIAGDGPLAGWMRQRAAESLAGRIHFCGTLDRDALATLYATVDVFVHPNPREPFGIAPLEAMASGVAVVVPDRGGVRTYASPRNAWLAAPTADAFADAIEAASLRRDSWRIARARSTAVEYSWRRATHRFFALYDEVTQHHAYERAACAVS
jgi:glycosyltransferase involved in cell wall biosynthesis